MTDLIASLRVRLDGRYTIDREIGHGGMATVFLAHDVRHNRPVAVKVLKPELAGAIGPERFLREIQVAARLRHPHIVPLFDSGNADGLLYYVMPYIDGESLRDLLRRGGRLPVRQALRIANEVADALAYAHREGVIHRDIKPDNVMLDGQHALVTDFGIARALTTDSTQTLTSTGLFIGTPAYMSPEQVTGEHELDGRSDVFSLGCVLFEMLAGQAPYSGVTPQAIMARRFASDTPSLAAVRPDVPADVSDIVARSMRTLPTERFQNASDMAEALDAAYSASRSEPSVLRGTPHLRARWMRPWLIVTGVIALAALAGWGVRAIRRSSATAAASQSLAAVPSVGVLPFANRSDDRQLEYFSDGITDELISALSRVSGLQVAGRTSSFSLKGKGLDAQQSAARLGVRYIIDGSLRMSGSTVRVSWQVMDGTTGRGVGTGDFTGEMKNVISLQDSLANSIVAALPSALGMTKAPAIPRHGTADYEAHDLYLRGHYYWNQRTAETMRQGISYLKQAIAKDSNYALAWAELSSAYTLEPSFGDMPPSQVMEPARQAALRAVQLDSTLAEAYTALGISSTFNDWNAVKAMEYLDRAVALDPQNSFPHLFRAWPLVMLGRVDDAVAELKRARELDPLSAIINTRLGTVLTYQKHYDEALTQLRQALAIDPGNVLARFELGKTLSTMGHYEEAIKEFPDAIDAEAGWATAWVAWAYGRLGRTKEAKSVLDRLEARARERYISRDAVVVSRLAAGDTSGALRSLDRAVQEHEIFLVFLKADPYYEGIKSTREYKAAIAKVGLRE